MKSMLFREYKIREFCSNLRNFTTAKSNTFNDTYRRKLNSVQECIKANSWQLLVFSVCLHNQLKFQFTITSISYKVLQFS